MEQEVLRVAPQFLPFFPQNHKDAKKKRRKVRR
jgi:hypothetical protein